MIECAKWYCAPMTDCMMMSLIMSWGEQVGEIKVKKKRQVES